MDNFLYILKFLFGTTLIVLPFFALKAWKKSLTATHAVLRFILTHLLIAITLQSLGLFTYVHLVVIHILFNAYFLKKAGVKNTFASIKNSLQKIDIVLLAVVLISILYLSSVHFNYSGTISQTNTKLLDVKNYTYQFPYFADEWYAIAFIKNSIQEHTLPIRNPFSSNKSFFVNFELAFHSLTASAFLLLGLDPLTSYVYISIASGSVLIVLLYVLLKKLHVHRLPAAFISPGALFITNGSNLPGIWTFIPFIFGTILFLIFFLSLISKNTKEILLAFFLTILFYPPLFPFALIALITYSFSLKKDEQKILLKKSLFLILIVTGFLSALFFLGEKRTYDIFSQVLFQKIYFRPFLENGIPRFYPWYIIPIPLLILGAVGFVSKLKDYKWLSVNVFVGILYWYVYSQFLVRFFIDYERIVVFSSYLTVLFAGLGFQYILKRFFLKRQSLPRQYLGVVYVIIFLAFILYYPNYTKHNSWKRLSLNVFNQQTDWPPEAPANNYYGKEDKRIFQNYSGKTFLSLPWKGTVIGAATDNFPLSTKSGTISINTQIFFEFVNANCEEKKNIVKKLEADLLYVPVLNCPNFTQLDSSTEGFVLYSFTDSK